MDVGTALTFDPRVGRDDVTGCHGDRASADSLQAVTKCNAAQQAAELRPTGIRHDLIGRRPVTWVT